MTQQTPHMKPPTHKQRRIASEEPQWIGQKESYWVPKLVLLTRNRTLSYDQLHKYMFSPHRGPFPHL